MEVGKVYKFIISGYDMNGLGVSKYDGIVVFVEKALDKEEVLAEITYVQKKYAFAKVVKVIKASPNRLPSLCPYYDCCGGCDLLHMDYHTECMIKEKKVRDAFSKICRLDNIHINPIISAKETLGYRNKVMVPFGKDNDGNIIYGFYQKRSHDLISIDNCIISNFYANEVIEFIRRYISVMNIPIYNEKTGKGIFRTAMVRNNYQNEMMVVLVVTKYIDISKLADYIKTDYPKVKSIYLNINDKTQNVILSPEYIHVYGDEFIIEDILGLKFKVSAEFMQVNHNQCEKLYTEAYRMANLQPNMNVIDAYCGMGSITLGIARYVNHVYGIEIVEKAIINANKNKELNNISNATFICGKCEEKIKQLVNKEKIDVIFFDPPRKGCDIDFLKTVVEMNIPKIVYISCNISTCCRDINFLKDNNYEVIEVTPVDLFSKTSHVEVIANLVLK